MPRAEIVFPGFDWNSNSSMQALQTLKQQVRQQSAICQGTVQPSTALSRNAVEGTRMCVPRAKPLQRQQSDVPLRGLSVLRRRSSPGAGSKVDPGSLRSFEPSDGISRVQGGKSSHHEYVFVLDMVLETPIYRDDWEQLNIFKKVFLFFGSPGASMPWMHLNL